MSATRHVIELLIFGFIGFAMIQLIIPHNSSMAPSSNVSQTPTTITQMLNATGSASDIRPLLQLLPLLFIAIIMLSLFRMLNPGSIFEGETESRPDPPSQPRLEPEPEPEPVTENCKNCGGPNVNRVTCQYCGNVLE